MAANAIFDRVSGAILLLLGIGAVWHGLSLKVAFAADPIGPKAFPILIGGILAFCGAAILIRPERIEWEAGDYRKVIAIGVASLIYPLLLEPLGFVPATAALCLVVARALGGEWAKSVLASVLLAIAIFCLIDLGLGLGLPRGPLGV